MKTIRLIIPNNKSVKSIEVLSTYKKGTNISNPIYPIQSNSDKKQFIEPDKDIYNSDKPYPEFSAKLIHEDIFDGYNKIATFSVYPMQYYPKKNKIELIKAIKLKVHLKDDISELAVPKKRSLKNQKLYSEILRNMVENPNDIQPYDLLQPSNNSYLAKPIPIEFFDYIIITSIELKPAFDEFISWKKRKGIDIGVVTTSSIYLNYTGDYVSGLFDNAGKIRQYLRDAYELGTTWVLLGGDFDEVPGRFSWGLDWGVPGYSDLYFADRNGNWNVDNDSKYGEENDDNVDYSPELFVGRIPCNTAGEVTIWTDKLLKYEQYPGNGNYSYLNRTYCQESDEMQSYSAGYNISQALPENFTTTIQGEVPGFDAPLPTAPYGGDIIAEINNTKYGFWFWENHGSATGNGVLTKNVNDDWLSTINVNSLDNLTNSNYPMIVYSDACNNANYIGSMPNLAEKYTIGIQNGGPVFLGNTMYGSTGGFHLASVFADLLIDYTGEVVRPSITNIGMTHYIAKFNYNMHLLALSHNLFGCPEMQIWTDIPQEFNNVNVLDLGNSIFVSVGENSTICLSSTDNGASFHQVVHEQSSYLFNTSVRPLYVTVTKKHYLPFTALTGGNLSNTITLTGKIEILNGLKGENDAKIIIQQSTKLIFDEEKSITADDKVVITVSDIKDIYNIEKTFRSVNKKKKDVEESFLKNNFIGNYPNPFNPETNLKYSLAEPSDVSIKIFNTIGQLVKEFSIENQNMGNYSILWNGKNFNNNLVSSGVYLVYFNTFSLKTKKKHFANNQNAIS